MVRLEAMSAPAPPPSPRCHGFGTAGRLHPTRRGTDRSHRVPDRRGIRRRLPGCRWKPGRRMPTARSRSRWRPCQGSAPSGQSSRSPFRCFISGPTCAHHRSVVLAPQPKSASPTPRTDRESWLHRVVGVPHRDGLCWVFQSLQRLTESFVVVFVTVAVRFVGGGEPVEMPRDGPMLRLEGHADGVDVDL